MERNETVAVPNGNEADTMEVVAPGVGGHGMENDGMSDISVDDQFEAREEEKWRQVQLYTEIVPCLSEWTTVQKEIAAMNSEIRTRRKRIKEFEHKIQEFMMKNDIPFFESGSNGGRVELKVQQRLQPITKKWIYEQLSLVCTDVALREELMNKLVVQRPTSCLKYKSPKPGFATAEASHPLPPI